jgi:hypothetical protein
MITTVGDALRTVVAWSVVAWLIIICAATLALADSKLPPATGVVAMQNYSGTYADKSKALSNSASDVVTAVPAGQTRVRLFIQNPDTSIDIWCRWGTAAGAPASVGGTSSFRIMANNGGRDIYGAGVPQGALNCIVASGTPNIYVEQY